MLPSHRTLWWEAMLPAGIWLLIVQLALATGKLAVSLGLPPTSAIRATLRLTIKLSRAGHHSWRFWGRKWR